MSLSSERIVRAAQDLLTDYGLHDVTMRRLASELGVRPGALYYHVPHKRLFNVERGALVGGGSCGVGVSA